MVNPLCVNISNMFIKIFLIIFSYKNVMIRAALFYFGMVFFFLSLKSIYFCTIRKISY